MSKAEFWALVAMFAFIIAFAIWAWTWDVEDD